MGKPTKTKEVLPEIVQDVVPVIVEGTEADPLGLGIDVAEDAVEALGDAVNPAVEVDAVLPVITDEVDASEILTIEDLAMKAAPNTSGNVANLVWPTDQYGLTKDLKTAVTQLASRVAGHPDKKQLVDAVLIIAIAHIKAKFDGDTIARELRLAESV